MSRPGVWVLGGEQTDFARNWSKEGKSILAMMREATLIFRFGHPRTYSK